MTWAALILSIVAATSAPEQVDVLVLVAEGTEASAEERQSLTTSLTQALDGRRGAHAVSIVDLRALVEIEGYRQVADCADDTSCLAELGNALGAQSLVSHRVTRLGERFVWQASLLDVMSGTALTRAEAAGANISDLARQARGLAQGLSPPSTLHNAVWWTGGSVMAIGLLGAGTFGAWTLAIDQTLKAPPSAQAQSDAYAASAFVPILLVGSVGVLVAGGVGVALSQVIE